MTALHCPFPHRRTPRGLTATASHPKKAPDQCRSPFLRFQPGKAEVMLYRQTDDAHELQASMWTSRRQKQPRKTQMREGRERAEKIKCKKFAEDMTPARCPLHSCLVMLSGDGLQPRKLCAGQSSSFTGKKSPSESGVSQNSFIFLVLCW